MKKLLASLVVVNFLAACASTSQKVPDPAPTQTNTNPSKPYEQPTATPVESKKPDSFNMDPLKDPNNILSKRSIYFDYDKYDVRPDFSATVDAHSKYLNSNKNRKIKIEGNADERGSREYNLALGQKRAEAVKKSMSVLGVSEAQIETVSLGEEKPKATGHDEAAWTENRRADIVYDGE
ncbi:peptidoglycan-associated lipoprotein Pal [Parachitinimonas caeni]|uniref:Peptidoglycan-associated lipoprotein n=1 Tax=Parachitinimonas caeni TaxID=3031301 RepID=A0ABT7DR19_9NEIS|nr:peptidoglycan-associated lipoprotein Pal [Parachitinimonas caeni]MDK2122516.1 peptidoglycan-associated lipoprotein Pal [Parachitinimonas caeni]